MKNKATWIVLSTSFLLLGWAIFSRTMDDATSPESASHFRNRENSHANPHMGAGDAKIPGESAQNNAAQGNRQPTPPSPITAAIANGPARFQMRSRNATTFFTPQGVTTAIVNSKTTPEEQDRADHANPDEEHTSDAGEELDGWAIHWELVGANEVEPEAKGELSGKVNWYTGKNEMTGLSTYSHIKYENVYEGVDLLVESRDKGMKYSLEVASEVDPNVIRMRYRGAESVHMSADGKSLKVETGVGTVEENELYVYQENLSGKRVQIPARYANVSQASGNLTWEYSIQVGDYDATLPLVIDPTISWGSYLGGNAGIQADDYGYGIAVSGTDIYVTGRTASSNFPATTGATQTTFGGSTYDAFVAKISASGSIIWATFLGGTGNNYGQDITVDSNGDPIAVGYTANDSMISTPTLSFQGGTYDAFVIKFDSAAGTTEWGTFVGGTSTDYGRAIALDGNDNIYIIGDSYSDNIPGVSNPNNGSKDAFLAKLDPTQQGALLWSQYLGGSETEYGYGISVSADGSRIGVTGYTGSASDFPVTLGAEQGTHGGGTYDIFAAVLENNSIAVNDYFITWATYLGGTYSYEYGQACSFDAAGNLNVTGRTQSDGLTTTGAFQTTLGGSNDLLIAQYNTTGSLNWATYLGGTSSEYGYDLATDSNGDIYLTGYTYSSTSFPTGSTTGFQSTSGSTPDAFVAKLDSTGTTLHWSSFFGGDSYDYGYAIAVDSSNNVYITGQTRSTDLVPGATLGGSSDAYVAKIDSTGTTLDWTIYLGGSESNTNTEIGYSIDTDSSGNIYLTGYTSAVDFVPTASAGAYSTYGGDKSDAFVVRLTSALTLDWVTYLGGAGVDHGYAIAVDSASSPSIYVAGYTGSTETSFPIVVPSGTTPNSWQETHGGGTYDGFITRFNSAGTIEWSYFVGGSSSDYIYAVALNANGDPYVGGRTYSSNIAGTNVSLAGSADFFVTKLGATSATPAWTAVHGGDGSEYLYDIALNNDDVYVTGYTASQNNFVSGSSTLYGGGNYDAFAAMIDNAGNLAWATYLGGDENDYARGIVTDSSGNAFIVGNTASTNVTSSLAYAGGSYDAFLAQVDNTGAQISFTYVGGSSTDYGEEIELSGNNVYLVGTTSSSNFPGIGSSTNSGSYDAFVSKIITGTTPSIDWSIYVGGSGADYGYALTLDSSSNIFLTGKTGSTDFPSAGGFNTTLAGTEDVFIAKVTDSGTTPQPTIGLSTNTLTFNAQVGGANPSDQMLTLNNTGSATLNWTATDDQTWLSIGTPTTGTLAAGNGTTLTISIDTSTLSTAGSYTGTITITDGGASNSPQTISVVLVMSTTPPTLPIVGVSVKTLNFTAEAGATNPSDQTVSITNVGAGTLNWTAAGVASWQTLAPPGGSVTTNADVLSVKVDITGLPEGIYSDTITISDPNATNSPESITVTLDITTPSGGTGTGNGTQNAPGNNDDDDKKKNPLVCGGSVAGTTGGGILPLLFAFFGLALLCVIRRKF